MLVSCDPPKSSPPPKLSFRQSAVVKSRAHRTYTNELLVNGKPATGNVSYRITTPADLKNIKIDENTGKLTFQEPVKVTVEAKHTKGSSATYTLTVTDHFSGRSSFTAVAIGSDIYVIGGRSSADNQNDVWKSTDGGVLWNKENTGTASTLFSARNGHSSVAVDSAPNAGIYVIGGNDGTNSFNDVWKSTDGGATWNQVRVTSTQFSVRYGHSSVVVDSGPNAGIYVIGGKDGTNLFNDVWRSTDGGATWNQVTVTSTQFSGRYGHSSVVVDSGPNAGIYVIGGYNGTNLFNDVWKSTNGGATWTQVATGIRFSARASHSSVAVGSDIYVIGGFPGGRRNSDEVWKSTDGGESWSQVATGTRFFTRSLHSSVAIGSDIYVVGGKEGTNRFNDVWKSTDSGVTWKNVHD